MRRKQIMPHGLLRLLALLGALLLLGACEKAMQNMYDQPKYQPMEKSELFSDGTSARTPPAGTQPHAKGPLAGTSSGRVGSAVVQEEQAALAARQLPDKVDMRLLQRGQERYQIYCMPCHSPVGDGDGWITRRGFPNPPSYHIQHLREASDRHFFNVITHGYGIMYPYADRVAPADRWAIIAYIRSLQLSQHVPADTLPPAMQAKLPKAAAAKGEAP